VVAASPGRLRAKDERMAGDAEAALGSLTWDQEAAGHYPARAAGVPVARAAAQGADGSGGKLHIAASLGRLLELVGLPRYAAICRGPRTAALLQAYEGGGRELLGPAGRRSALAWTCRTLPDLPGPRLWFARGPVMGEREADAFV
jgi:hypothetical protein